MVKLQTYIIGDASSVTIKNKNKAILCNPPPNLHPIQCKNCNNNLNNSESQFQRQQLIQNTVRIPASVYTATLAALTTYQTPNTEYRPVTVAQNTYLISPKTNWNQMSDRREPHIQTVITANGTTGNSTRRTIVRNRPNAMSAGGTGVDIKHNSYERYLNRIKGKGPLRQGRATALTNSGYIPFNQAFPVYGDKTFMAGIVPKCVCAQ